MQGASIALGRYVHGKVTERRPLYEKLAAIREFEAAKHLLRDADTMLKLAMTAETKPDGEHALRLLGSQRKLLADELAVLEAAATDPAKRKALNMSEATLRGLRGFARDQIAEMNAQDLSELPLHAGGLEKLVPDADAPEWKGSRSQIQRAIAAAKRAGIDVEGKPDADGVWRQMKIGGRPIKLHERAEAGKSTGGTHHASKNPRVSAAAAQAKLDVNALTDAQRGLLETADSAISNGDLHRAAQILDDLAASGVPRPVVARFEAALAAATGKTNPAVYRDAKARLPNGKLVSPNVYGGELHYGTDSITPEVAFEKGLPGRGDNTDLLQHVHQASDSAFRGTTRHIFDSDGGGAGQWAGENGWVYKIDGTPSWDLNAQLDGRVPRPDGSFAGNPMYGEHEQAVLANIPRERIVGAIRIVERNGRLIPQPMIANPHYKPLK